MRRPEYEGQRLTISCMVRPSGQCPAGRFLDDELTDAERTKGDVIFQRLGDHGQLRNATKFKKVGDDIWAIKSGQIRIFCFRSAGRLILAFGLRKKSNRHKPKDIARATSMRTEFLNQIQREG